MFPHVSGPEIPVTLLPTPSSDIYHDIYDFSLFPISLGDILTWGVKSALRASAAGRSKVHIHLITDPQKSGFSPLQATSYLVDLFVVEAVPAFYSHPLFSGLSVYRSREDFEQTFGRIAANDTLAMDVYREHQSEFLDRANYDRLGAYFKKCCSNHDDINEHYRQTGNFPRVGYLPDCLLDWHGLQSQFPRETFWVTVQFRLRKLDSGMPVSPEGLQRDAPFLTWFKFMDEARKRFPSVRFVLLGRLQEKPLEVLRLSNVVVLRVLGMNLAHELTALLHSDLYMGSPSGFAQAAHFSEVPYDVFNCTEAGCENYGIPFGAPQIPSAIPRQRLHYGLETSDDLLDCLKRALEESSKSKALPEKFEVNRVSTTDRYFISDSQSETELISIFSSRLKSIALTVEAGDLSNSRKALDSLVESFPQFATHWPDFVWLSGLVESLLKEDLPSSERSELLADVSRYCHPHRLIRRSGRYFDNLLVSEGLEKDGWCEEKARLVFAPSKRGDFLMLQINRLSGDEPVQLSVKVNRQESVRFVLLNEYALLEIPLRELHIPTEVLLLADRSSKTDARGKKKYSYQLEGAALVSKRIPMASFYRGDKRDPRDKIVSGIYTNGAASSLTRVRLDNPFPEDADVAVHIVGMVPRFLRVGQWLRIQINDEKPHECVISGKHFEAWIPCPGRPSHVSLLLQFWDKNGSDAQVSENRMIIKSIDLVEGSHQNPEIRTGLRGFLSYLLRRNSK